MGLPRKLKNMNAFVDGESYMGVVAEFVPPPLVIATEEWRGGGSIGPVMIDMGLEAMEATVKMGGNETRLFRKFGATAVDGVRLRLVGAYQQDTGAMPQAVEVVIGGRFTEINMNTSKPGQDTEHDYTVAVAYYRMVVDGRPEVEIDMVAGTFIVDGVSRYEEIMRILQS
jgi:uncharacterized protein